MSTQSCVPEAGVHAGLRVPHTFTSLQGSIIKVITYPLLSMLMQQREESGLVIQNSNFQPHLKTSQPSDFLSRVFARRAREMER